MKNKHKFLQLTVYVLVLLMVIIGFILLFRRYPDISRFFTDQTKIRSYITNYGVKAPFILIGLQVFQIVFAPIPGHILGFAAGYLFGALNGTLYCLAGIFIGASIAFWIGRLFGRRLLQTFINPDKMHHFDNYVIHKGPFVIFVLLLLPFSPLGDIIYFLSGLTAIPFLIYILIVLIARIPNNFINNLIGAKAFTFTVREWIIFAVVLAVLAFIFYLNRKRIENLIHKLVKY